MSALFLPGSTFVPLGLFRINMITMTVPQLNTAVLVSAHPLFPTPCSSPGIISFCYFSQDVVLNHLTVLTAAL